MGCLYMLTAPSGKSYIGITSRTAVERWGDHVYAKPRRYASCVRAAIKKYGPSTFTVRTLVIADSWDYLCELERNAIARYGTLAPGGYNLDSGGNSGRVMCTESQERHRARTSEGTRRAWAEGKMAGRAATFADPEYRRRAAMAVSVATKRAFQDPVKRANLVASRRAEEFRTQASESMTRLWADPEYRAAQTERFERRPPQSKESNRRRSESAKKLIAERKAAGTYWHEKGTKR